MKLENDKIYSDDGRLLKTLRCPFSFNQAGIRSSVTKNPLCSSCEKRLINTDYYTETELETVLESDKDVCHLINRFNPIFRGD